MSASARPVGEDDLVALVDNRLDPARRAAVDAYLASHPEEAARVRKERDIVGDLRGALAGRAEEPIPARLRIAVIAAERRRRRMGRLRAAAAALLWIALGAGGGWFAKEMLQARREPVRTAAAAMVGEALAAHRTFTVETVHPVEVKADQEAHLAQWLSRRLGRKLVIPDLDGQGLRLVGGRLLPAGKDVAAQLMYAGATGQRVTLYVRSGETETAAPRVVREGDLLSAYWSEAGFGYALSGAVDRDRLLVVAKAVHGETEDGVRRPRP